MLALGAKAVLIEQPAILGGVAVDGSEGVQNVLELLRDELAMALAGCSTLEMIDLSYLSESHRVDRDIHGK